LRDVSIERMRALLYEQGACANWLATSTNAVPLTREDIDWRDFELEHARVAFRVGTTVLWSRQQGDAEAEVVGRPYRNACRCCPFGGRGRPCADSPQGDLGSRDSASSAGAAHLVTACRGRDPQLADVTLEERNRARLAGAWALRAESQACALCPWLH
jgi:hypothetical protein